MAAITGYTAFLYTTIPGQIVGEVPIIDTPNWTRQINNVGSWSVKIQIGATNGWSAQLARRVADSQRFSIAIFWGDYCCQAGPVMGYTVDDAAGTVEYKGGGLWNLLNERLAVSSTWNPAAKTITDVSADITVTGSLKDIAIKLVTAGTTSSFRAAMGLPLDFPSTSGATTNTRTYFGYEMASIGQRLQELTQVDGGPDIDFAPYRVPGTNTIRHNMVVGNPEILQTGGAVVFDYGSTLQSLGIDGDGSRIATTAWVKGSGNERGQLVGFVTSTKLTDAGWPQLDYVDTSHNSAIDQATLTGWAQADLDLYGRSIESWKGVVRTDGASALGTYDPGFVGTYNLNGHPWVPDGQYGVRILGIGSGPSPNTVTHILDGQGTF